jgi:hypothetical protein
MDYSEQSQPTSPTSSGDDGEMIKIRVGAVDYSVQPSIFLRVPDGLLARIFSPSKIALLRTTKLNLERPRGELFKYIIQWYVFEDIDEKEVVEEFGEQGLEDLKDEAKFFGVYGEIFPMFKGKKGRDKVEKKVASPEKKAASPEKTSPEKKAVEEEKKMLERHSDKPKAADATKLAPAVTTADDAANTAATTTATTTTTTMHQKGPTKRESLRRNLMTKSSQQPTVEHEVTKRIDFDDSSQDQDSVDAGEDEVDAQEEEEIAGEGDQEESIEGLDETSPVRGRQERVESPPPSPPPSPTPEPEPIPALPKRRESPPPKATAQQKPAPKIVAKPVVVKKNVFDKKPKQQQQPAKATSPSKAALEPAPAVPAKPKPKPIPTTTPAVNTTTSSSTTATSANTTTASTVAPSKAKAAPSSPAASPPSKVSSPRATNGGRISPPAYNFAKAFTIHISSTTPPYTVNLRPNENLQLVSVTGNGKLYMSCGDTRTRTVVVQKGLVYDSSSYFHTQGHVADFSKNPPYPGSFLYEFLAEKGEKGDADLKIKFKQLFAFDEKDLVSSPDGPVRGRTQIESGEGGGGGGRALPAIAVQQQPPKQQYSSIPQQPYVSLPQIAQTPYQLQPQYVYHPHESHPPHHQQHPVHAQHAAPAPSTPPHQQQHGAPEVHSQPYPTVHHPPHLQQPTHPASYMFPYQPHAPYPHPQPQHHHHHHQPAHHHHQNHHSHHVPHHLAHPPGHAQPTHSYHGPPQILDHAPSYQRSHGGSF